MSHHTSHRRPPMLIPSLLALLLLGGNARAREVERFYLSGSHWDGSGTLQLLHPTSLEQGAAFVGAWADTSGNLRWSDNAFVRASGFGVSGGYAIIRNLRLEAALPTWVSLVREDAAGNQYASNGFGDLRLGATLPLIQGASGLGFAVAPYVLTPTGDPAEATGGEVGGGVTAAIGGRGPNTPEGARGFGWRLNAGWHGGGTELSSGANLGAGVDASPVAGVTLGAELTTLLRMGDPVEGSRNPVEGHGYVTVGLDEHLLGTLGGGAGLVPGEGSPEWRVLLAVGWHAAGRQSDPDGDGVLGSMDLCPTTPEGPGGDGDGCPEPDRDDDGVPDAVDACPDEPEDDDDFADRDGCPEPDNDLDGLLDENDLCPREAGSIETQGCPDEDGDGIANLDDECPTVRGPARSFGCPDMDGDAVPDYRDACPSEPDAEDADPKRSNGCPGLAWAAGDRINIGEQVQFDFNRATIRAESRPLLMAVAQVLKDNPDIALVEVAGHADAIGGESYNLRLSRLRAAAVRQFLIEQGGIAPSRLVAKGYGEELPVDTNVTDEGRFFNRRVEFLVQRIETPARRR